ncbi:MAG TPA: helix-turn-helix domain-containing protein [Pseudonocardia sp.]|jgi:AcrR family transcriptional regulator|nr:helix-turn-helix domain-containing protein [Pseudonocardia sp.]
MARGAGPVVRDAKKAATRRALVEHAVALFEEFGFEKTTVDDIVAAAGCSQRTFFRHFAAKEDVVFEGIPERLAELTALLADVPVDESGWTAVRDSMRLLTRRYTDEDPELTAVRIRLWMTEPLLYARWTEISLTWERELTRFLVNRRTSGEAATAEETGEATGEATGGGAGDRPDPEAVFDLEAEVAAAAVIAALRAAWRGEVLHGGAFDELVQRALGLLERGLADL